MKLIKLTYEYKDKLIEMIDEWKKDQLLNNTNKSPSAIFRNDPHDFDYYLKNLSHEKEENGLVPDSVLFMVDESIDRLIGAVNIRHKLNEDLLMTGGHIGDGIRPSERKKGYGTLLIKLALDECKNLGIDRVLITCNSDNIGSKKCIIKNGGVLENIVLEDGLPLERYWIDNR